MGHKRVAAPHRDIFDVSPHQRTTGEQICAGCRGRGYRAYPVNKCGKQETIDIEHSCDACSGCINFFIEPARCVLKKLVATNLGVSTSAKLVGIEQLFSIQDMIQASPDKMKSMTCFVIANSISCAMEQTFVQSAASARL